MLLGEAGAEYLLHIVYVVPAVTAFTHSLDVLLGEIGYVIGRSCDFPVGQLVHHLGHIIIIGKLGAVHELREVGVHRGTHGAVVGDAGVSLVTLAGGHDDYAAGGLEAVYRGRCTIFQDGDGLNIGRIYIVDALHGEAVHNVCYAVHGAADAEGGLVKARLTGFLHGGDTGKLTGKHL